MAVGRSHDNIAELVGVDLPSFESKHRKALLDVKRDFLNYVKEVKKAGNKADDDIGDIGDTVFLKYNDAGFPIVVGYKAGSSIPKKRLEDLLRTYLRRHYCKFNISLFLRMLNIISRPCIWRGGRRGKESAIRAYSSRPVPIY